MKYYSQETMKPLRGEFEEKILRWDQVSTKQMFGCPCYQANGKLFAFLVTNGVVVTGLSQADRETLSGLCRTTAFRAGGKLVRNWVRVPVEKGRDLDRVMPFVKKSYEAALRKSQGRH